MQPIFSGAFDVILVEYLICSGCTSYLELKVKYNNSNTFINITKLSETIERNGASCELSNFDLIAIQ